MLETPSRLDLLPQNAKSYQENTQVTFVQHNYRGFWFYERVEKSLSGLSKNDEELIEESPARTNGLGPYFNTLPDSLVMRIFELLGEKDLCTCSLVSKAFYLFAEDDELWKPFCLRKRRGDFAFQGSWKRAALFDKNQRLKYPYKRLVVDGKWIVQNNCLFNSFSFNQDFVPQSYINDGIDLTSQFLILATWKCNTLIEEATSP
jgi:hypothetical protein